MEKTVFEKIIDRELKADIVYEDDRIIAIRDIHPQAPVHLLLISKKAIPSIQEVGKEDFPLVAELISLAQKLAKQEGIEKGYRLVTNIGPSAGQSIFHLHFHLVGGEELGRIA